MAVKLRASRRAGGGPAGRHGRGGHGDGGDNEGEEDDDDVSITLADDLILKLFKLLRILYNNLKISKNKSCSKY